MAKLRFERWQTPNGGECSAVGAGWDRVRYEGARLVEVFYAATIEEAMIRHHAQNGWEPYKPAPDITDRPFTEAQVAEQEAYLAVRPPKWRRLAEQITPSN